MTRRFHFPSPSNRRYLLGPNNTLILTSADAIAAASAVVDYYPILLPKLKPRHLYWKKRLLRRHLLDRTPL